MSFVGQPISISGPWMDLGTQRLPWEGTSHTSHGHKRMGNPLVRLAMQSKSCLHHPTIARGNLVLYLGFVGRGCGLHNVKQRYFGGKPTTAEKAGCLLAVI
jgi:hypothetical protein